MWVHSPTVKRTIAAFTTMWTVKKSATIWYITFTVTNMTRAAGEAFGKLAPGRRILMFSRSSYIGMHRYGGIWTGDNKSWWSHLLLNIKQMPSLNMCGFLYSGSDLGGFGCNTTRDLAAALACLRHLHSADAQSCCHWYQRTGILSV